VLLLHCLIKYVAEKILSINENGNLKNPPPPDPPARAVQDEEIFQRARLVNTGFFVQVILRDYVGAILGLARDGSPWRLDPLMVNQEDYLYDLLADICDSVHVILTMTFPLAAKATLCQSNSTYCIAGMHPFLRRMHCGLRTVLRKRCQASI
jgi:hypothetical protein